MNIGYSYNLVFGILFVRKLIVKHKLKLVQLEGLKFGIIQMFQFGNLLWLASLIWVGEFV
jgi:hypothetical protein